MFSISYGIFFCLFGFILSIKAEYWTVWQDDNVQNRKVEQKDNERTPGQWDVKVSNLTESQQKELLDNKPKIIEKTKVLEKIRKSKDEVEERTRVIYQTRLIGQFNPKSQSDVNFFNLAGNVFGWPFDSKDDSDRPEANKEENAGRTAAWKAAHTMEKELGRTATTDIFSTAKTSQPNEMPADKHSSKKELQNNSGNEKTTENLTDKNSLNKSNTESTYVFSTKKPSEFRKVHFADTIEEDTTDAKLKPTETFHKVNFVDSLELYRNQQLQKQRLLNELRNNLNGNTNNIGLAHLHMRPILHRQNAFYGHPMPKFNNPFNVKGETLDKPLDSTILKTTTNKEVDNDKAKTNIANEETTNKIKSEPIYHTFRPNWIESLLIAKLAEAARAEAEKSALMHQHEVHQKEPEVLHHVHQKVSA